MICTGMSCFSEENQLVGGEFNIWFWLGRRHHWSPWDKYYFVATWITHESSHFIWWWIVGDSFHSCSPNSFTTQSAVAQKQTVCCNSVCTQCCNHSVTIEHICTWKMVFAFPGDVCLASFVPMNVMDNNFRRLKCLWLLSPILNCDMQPMMPLNNYLYFVSNLGNCFVQQNIFIWILFYFKLKLTYTSVATYKRLQKPSPK